MKSDYSKESITEFLSRKYGEDIRLFPIKEGQESQAYWFSRGGREYVVRINSNMEGFKKDVQMIKTMGFDGKSIINPRQIVPTHEIFTPSEKEIRYAEQVVREIDTKKAMGIGVFTINGKMLDIAFYDGAKRTLALAKAAGVYKGEL